MVGTTMADSFIPISDEQAKAIREVAKATGIATEVASKAGSYVAWVLGTVPRDLVDVLGGNWLAHVRIRNAARRAAETEKILRDRGVTETQPVPPVLAIPLLRGATDEEREQLTDLWARLIANAMDPKLGTVRNQFIEAVKQMDPPDAIMLHHLYTAKVGRVRPGAGGTPIDAGFDSLAGKLDVRQDDVEVSVRNLEHLGFLRTSPNDQNIWFPSAKLREFMRACYPELKLDD
jgi:hypothetical protein